MRIESLHSTEKIQDYQSSDDNTMTLDSPAILLLQSCTYNFRYTV